MANKKPRVGYKVVDFRNGEMIPLGYPVIKYRIGKAIRHKVETDNTNNLYVYPTLLDTIARAKNSHPTFAPILYCKYSKPVIPPKDFDYKIFVSGITPISIVGIVVNGEYKPLHGDQTWLLEHLTKYEAGKLPPQSAEIICGNQVFHIDDCSAVKKGRCRELIKVLKVGT